MNKTSQIIALMSDNKPRSYIEVQVELPHISRTSIERVINQLMKQSICKPVEWSKVGNNHSARYSTDPHTTYVPKPLLTVEQAKERHRERTRASRGTLVKESSVKGRLITFDGDECDIPLTRGYRKDGKYPRRTAMHPAFDSVPSIFDVAQRLLEGA